jgi:hypothetical protein
MKDAKKHNKGISLDKLMCRVADLSQLLFRI